MSKCNDCNKKFSKLLRIPKILNCNDSVCILCIYKFICHDSIYKCVDHPNTYVRNEKELEKLPTNLNLMKIIENITYPNIPFKNNLNQEKRDININKSYINHNVINQSKIRKKCLLKYCQNLGSIMFKWFCSEFCYNKSFNNNNNNNMYSNNLNNYNSFFNNNFNENQFNNNFLDFNNNISYYKVKNNKCSFDGCNNRKLLENGKELPYCSNECYNLDYEDDKKTLQKSNIY